MKKWLALLSLPLLLVGCISIPVGDGEKIKISKDGLEMENKDGEKSSISIDEKEGSATIELDDGSKVDFGSNTSLPKMLPKDILLPENATILQSVETTTDGRLSSMASFEVEGNALEDVEMYYTYLIDNGYEVEKLELNNTMFVYQGSKESESLSYQLIANDEGEPTYTLSIMYTKDDSPSN